MAPAADIRQCHNSMANRRNIQIKLKATKQRPRLLPLQQAARLQTTDARRRGPMPHKLSKLDKEETSLLQERSYLLPVNLELLSL